MVQEASPGPSPNSSPRPSRGSPGPTGPAWGWRDLECHHELSRLAGAREAGRSPSMRDPHFVV